VILVQNSKPHNAAFEHRIRRALEQPPDISLYGASTKYQVKDQGNYRNNQEQVNQTAGDMKRQPRQ
jgi:hypothetical protein